MEAARNSASPAHTRRRDRHDSESEASCIAAEAPTALSAGRLTSISKASPPTMASPPCNISHRRNGAKGDWSSGCSGGSMASPLRGWPTAKTKEPRTRWPSTVETFFQATV